MLLGIRGTPATLAGLLMTRSEREPDRLAFRFLPDGEDEGARLTYADLDRRAREVAARLFALDATGERAILVHPPGLEYIEALFGCWYAGVVPVPAYPPRSGRAAQNLARMANDAGARFAIAPAPVRQRLEVATSREPALGALTWVLPDPGSPASREAILAVPRPEGSLALLQYTSGSTSAPRGVMLSHENLIAQAKALLDRIRVAPEDHEVSWLPPYHDMGLVGAIVAPVMAGGGTTFMPPMAFLQRPLRWLEAVSRFGATVTGGPDFAWDLCVRRATPAQVATLDLRSLRVAFTGAERVRPETLARFAATFAPAGFRPTAFSPCYGLAEATLGVTFHPAGETPRVESFDEEALTRDRAEPALPGKATRALAGSGIPLDGCEIRIVDPETRRPRRELQVGEIWVRSPGVGAGYWNQPELSERTFRARLEDDPDAAPTWLRTGDLGVLRDGELFVTGRLKDLLVLAGTNRYPEDIEATAGEAHPSLRPRGCAAFSVESAGEERLVVVHEVDDPRHAPLDEIRESVSGAIAEAHDVPVREIVLVPPGGVPRTSSGKVQRRLCRERYLAGDLPALGGDRPRAARGAPEDAAAVEQIASLMAGVLGIGKVGPEEDFFALGGHSLMATQLASRLRDELGLEVPLRAIFESPTPAALAARRATFSRASSSPDIPTVDRTRPLRLSFSQERMWHLHRLDPGGSAYNVAGAVVVDGPLDADVFRRSLAQVVDRHESLRTRYTDVDGVPWGVLGPAPSTDGRVEDLSEREDPEGAAIAFATELASTPFDLEHDEPVRARLLRLAPTRHVVAVCAHHVAMDGWSMGILLEELLDTYGSLVEGRDASRPPPGRGYADYAAWQRDRLGPDVLAGEVSHWRRRLEGAPLLELSTDRPRGSGPSRSGGLEPLDLPAELVERLRDVARSDGATLYMIMLAAFEVLLHRHTGQVDIVVGTPVANRHRAEAEKLVGTLVNTVPVRVQVDADAPFRELLRGVREASLDAFTHQELPFERLVSALPIQRRAGQMPLFPVLFDLLNAPMPARRAGQLTLRPLVFTRRASQFDLSFSMMDTSLGQRAAFEYDTDLFDAATVRRMAGHYRVILEAVAADPGQAVARIPLLTPTERDEATARAAATCGGRQEVVPVHLLVEAQAARAPDAVAVVDGGGEMTYRELQEASRMLASRLGALGAKPGERVAVCLERSRAIPVALLAVLRTGAAYVPLDPRYPEERLGYVLADSAPVALVTEEGLCSQASVPPGTAVLRVNALLPPDLSGAGVSPFPVPPGPAGTAYVIYTSGSTGRPKGVEVPHLALSNFLASMADDPGLTPADRVLSVTTISFDIAALEIFLPLVTGARVHLATAEEAADGSALATLLRSSGATVMQGTPATWRLLLEAGWTGDPRLRILCGGEALPRDLANRLLDRGAEVWNLYGPTETTIWSALGRVRRGEGPVPVGFPIAHTRIYVLDRHGEFSPVGVPGEIHIGGVGVATGYWRRPELTAEKFVRDPYGDPEARMYRTGDLGRIRGDGALEYLCRMDQQLKIRGHRIEPGEIEAVLREHPGVAAAAVVAQEAGPGDLRLAAYYVARGEPGPSRSELREALARRLPDYMIPAYLVQLETLPLTPNGKLDRNALPPPTGGHAVVDVPRIAPRDEVEATLVRHFQEVLGSPVTSVREGFFDLGGHSLLAARLFARIERSLGVSLPHGALLEHQTVEQLATLIRERRPGSPAPPARPSFVVPIQAAGTRAPFFCVHGAGGNVLNLVALGRHLAPDRPFYGVQARGLDGVEAPFASIEQMADAYLAELRAVQPRGPYFLGGYCGGGLVAFEMAQRLVAAGERVALLALVDSPSPLLPSPEAKFRRWSRTMLAEDASALLRRAGLKWRRDLGAARVAGALRLHQARGGPVPHELRDQWLTNEFLHTAARYDIRPYPGTVVLLRARDESRTESRALGWEGLAAGGLRIEDVPGNHHSLAQEPHVRVLGAKLEAFLQEAEAPPSASGSGYRVAP